MLTSTLPRWAGDAEPGFILDLARELNADFDIELIAPHAPGAATSEVMQGVARYAVPVLVAPLASRGLPGRNGLADPRESFTPCAAAVLLWVTGLDDGSASAPRASIDLIHAHWLIPQGLAALVARRLANRPVPVLCTSHGGDLFGLRGSLLTRLKRAILQRCEASAWSARPWSPR
jgi:phosphatidyl-myo-inositol dimannoside synthase